MAERNEKLISQSVNEVSCYIFNVYLQSSQSLKRYYRRSQVMTHLTCVLLRTQTISKHSSISRMRLVILSIWTIKGSRLLVLNGSTSRVSPSFQEMRLSVLSAFGQSLYEIFEGAYFFIKLILSSDDKFQPEELLELRAQQQTMMDWTRVVSKITTNSAHVCLPFFPF